MTLAIIVPMLNEAAELPDLLRHLRAFAEQGAEILLIDGGSHDASAAIARSAGFSVHDSERGRALQMNAGARLSQHEVLLFLHADTRLPKNAMTAIEQALASPHHVWGRFDVRISGQSPVLALIALLMNLRSRFSGIATGDQAIFMTRAAFDAIGGFPEQPLMEDIAISRALKPLSTPACLRDRVITSGRRWQQRGIWRTIFLMWRLRWRYWRGASADTIARAYR